MPGICPRCSKQVYFAEELKAKGEVYHKLCFKCCGCNKLLEPGNFSETDGDIFCKTCYGKNFGPRGYGFGGGAGVLSMDNGTGTVPLKAGKQETKAVTSSQVPSVSPSEKEVKAIPVKAASVTSATTSLTSPTKTAVQPRWGGGNICPKCSKTVYFAEQLKAAYQTWHKGCFTCNTCNKGLDTSTVCDNANKLYCRPCYGRNFGPKGVGYGVGAGTLQTN